MRFDFHPTPSHVADMLVAFAHSEAPRTVADFTAGNGSLLVAAQQRWPHAVKIATEIQGGLVGHLRSNFPDWQTGRCDFLSDASVRSCGALKNRAGTVDVILLNPPFASSTIDRKGKQPGRVPTVAIEFLERATRYASPNSEICAILPASCLHNEKDRSSLDRIASSWNIKVVGKTTRRTFSECAAESSMVHMTRRPTDAPLIAAHTIRDEPGLELVRGSMHMHLAQRSRSADAAPLVHSTNLKQGAICGKTPLVLSNRYFEGPAVLLHRVGRPSPDKISLLDKGSRVVLSDCVIAIPVSSQAKARALREKLVGDFDLLSSAYIGTGAPFITLGRLKEVLRKISQ